MEESSPRTIIDSFKSFLVYYLDFSLLLYKKYKIALFRNSLRAYIKGYLDNLSIPSLNYKEVLNFFASYNLSTSEDIY